MAEIKANLKSFDDLFKSSEQLQQEKLSGLTPSDVEISKLKPFGKHPFKMYDTDKLNSLAESIKEQGVIVPILIRPIKDGKFEYEIIAGHNRVQASRVAGIDTIPCIIREMDNETATILMVDSNLQQRESILPSEKAFAYKYKLEAIKAQGKRTDLTSCQVGTKFNSADEIADSNDDSRRDIYRYIRLTNLIPNLLDKVDERKLAFIPAVELSYLKKKEQEFLYDILNREENFSVPLKQASTLKGISQNGDLTYEKIDSIITEKVKSLPPIFKVSYKKVKDYFPNDVTPKQFEHTVMKALEYYFENQQDLELER